MKRILLLGLGIGLVACGTPQEQCIDRASHDLRVVEGFIAESEANLARGYAMAEVTEIRPDWVDCTPEPTEGNPDPEPQKCLVDVAETEMRPVAIDLDAEAAKLASLRAKRAQLVAQAGDAVALCRQQYPE
jgi:hypothetical protein